MLPLEPSQRWTSELISLLLVVAAVIGARSSVAVH